MVLLLLIAAGGVVFTAVLCALRVRSSRSEVRGDTDRVYDTIQEREVIATDVGEGGGGDVGGWRQSWCGDGGECSIWPCW